MAPQTGNPLTIIGDSLIDAQRQRQDQDDDKSESNSSNNENQVEQNPDAIALQPISESPQDDPLPVQFFW